MLLGGAMDHACRAPGGNGTCFKAAQHMAAMPGGAGGLAGAPLPHHGQEARMCHPPAYGRTDRICLSNLEGT